MESLFRISCTTTDGDVQTTILTGPADKNVEDAAKILKLAASYYDVIPDSIKVEPYSDDVPGGKRMGKGFLHPVYCLLDDGRECLVEGWYL